MNCPRCQAVSEVGARFCVSCGSVLAATSLQGGTVVSPDRDAGRSKVGTAPLSRAMASQVLRNACAQTIVHAKQREHVLLVDDISGSMAEEYTAGMSKLDAVKRANEIMIREKTRLDPDDHVGLIVFNSQAQVIMPLAQLAAHESQLIKEVRDLQIIGGTDIDAGLQAARDTFDWSLDDIVRRIVLLTDGQGGQPLQTAEDLKEKRVVIDVIGVGPRPAAIDEALLKKVASAIRGQLHYRFIKDQQTLIGHYTHLAQKTQVAS